MSVTPDGALLTLIAGVPLPARASASEADVAPFELETAETLTVDAGSVFGA